MANIRFEGEDKEVPDGSEIQEHCEDIGMPFGCTDGICGTCRCTVVSGMENLESLTEREQDMGLAPDERLPCQLVIKSGDVEFSIG